MSEFIANGRVEETVQTVDFTEGHNFGEAQVSGANDADVA